jgi:hypothetical protein
MRIGEVLFSKARRSRSPNTGSSARSRRALFGLPTRGVARARPRDRAPDRPLRRSLFAFERPFTMPHSNGARRLHGMQSVRSGYFSLEISPIARKARARALASRRALLPEERIICRLRGQKHF